MIKIEDKTIKHYGTLVQDSLKRLFPILPPIDIEGIEKILLLDKCPDPDFEWCAGFYRASKDRNLAYIELYPEKIINGIPRFLPKIYVFKKYSIVRMFLHELGHHNLWDKNNPSKKEAMADKYMLFYIDKFYGYYNIFFNFMGFIDAILSKIRINTK